MTSTRPIAQDMRDLDAALSELLAGGEFDPSVLASLDQNEAFPVEACAALDRLGLAQLYVPVEHGGSLRNLNQLVTSVRAIARHDLTVAIAHAKTFLGAVSVWVAGDSQQAARLGERVKNGAVVSWGLTERGHGSDLLNCEVFAESLQSGGWRLNGEKWLINNASRADLICVLARTRLDGGARGFSLFLIDKSDLRPDSYSLVPKVRTHGIRGADISGIGFVDAEIPADSLVGSVGAGLEIVMKSLQLTRIACCGLSLGAGEHALELALKFTKQRVLYGHNLSELPTVRREIGEIAAGLLLSEAALTVTANSVSETPDELSVLSPLIKAFVPSLVQLGIDRSSELLGSRGFLTEEFANGAMAKLDRDHQIVSIFDGTTLVNRSALISQFSTLNRTHNSGGVAVPPAALLDRGRGTLNVNALKLLSRSGCTIMRSLDDTVAEVVAKYRRGEVPIELVQSARRLAAYAAAMGSDGVWRSSSPRCTPTSLFRIAERYEFVFAGAAALQLWLGNPHRHEDPLWRNGLWVRSALALANGRLGPDAPDSECVDNLAQILLGGGIRISLRQNVEKI